MSNLEEENQKDSVPTTKDEVPQFIIIPVDTLVVSETGYLDANAWHQ